MKKDNSEQLKHIHTQAMKGYEASFSAEQEQRDLCIEDMAFAFVPGSQWSSVDSQQRSDRPRMEINKVIHPLNQIIGEQRQNRISTKVRASKSGASKEVADVMSGIIRSIENKSDFKSIKDVAFKELASGGIGGWYVTTQYINDDSFDQEIKLKSITGAASSIYYDPAATDELKRDASWIMVTTDVSKEWFEKRYPDVPASDMPDATQSATIQDWQNRDTVRIADYWVKEPYIKTIALMSDNTIIEMNDKNKSIVDELALAGIHIVKTRKKPCHKVVMYKINASQVLEGPFEFASEMIPVVPVFGYNVWISGNHYYNGMVRMAKDPQRVYNYATSQAIETSALSPKDPYWVTHKQMQGLEGQMKTFNTKNSPFMFYNEDESSPGAPKRGGAPSVQTGLIQQIQQADMDIQSTTGLYAPSLGQDTSDKSGRAILALQKQSNTSTHELVDNLVKAVEYTSKILVEMIPTIYDTERQISILGDDGVSTSVNINKSVIDQATGQEIIVNDLAVGMYEVTAGAGPSYATERSETLNLLTKLADTNPSFAAVSADLIAKSVDFSESEELTKRVRKQMLAQGLIDPNEEETQAMQSQQPAPPSAVDQINFKMLQLQLEQQGALVDQIEMQNRKIQADLEHKLSQTQENLTNVIMTKTKINTELDKQGKEIDFPIEPGELQARSNNLRVLNENLELDYASVDQLNDEAQMAIQAQQMQAMQQEQLIVQELPPELPPEA